MYIERDRDQIQNQNIIYYRGRAREGERIIKGDANTSTNNNNKE